MQQHRRWQHPAATTAKGVVAVAAAAAAGAEQGKGRREASRTRVVAAVAFVVVGCC